MNPNQYNQAQQPNIAPLKEQLSGLTEEQLKCISENQDVKKILLRTQITSVSDLQNKNEDLNKKILDLSKKQEQVKHDENVEKFNSLNNRAKLIREDISFLNTEIEKNSGGDEKQQLLDTLDTRMADLKSLIDKNNSTRLDLDQKLANNETLALEYRKLTVLSSLIKSGAQFQ